LRRRTSCLLIILFAVPFVLDVQSLRAQESIAAYWTRLTHAASLEVLHSVPVPTGADSVLAEELLRLRRYELAQDRTEALVARTNLERLARHSRSADVHFALGLALARGPDVRVVVGDSAEQYFATPFSNAAKQAPRSLKRALELDPQLHEAAYVLAEFALDLGDRPLMGDALRALGRDGRERHARAQQLSARILSALEEHEGAAAAADSATALGADPSVSAYIKAAALLRRRGAEYDGARAYFAGIDVLTEAGAREYFEAIATVVSPGEAARWKGASSLAEKREWLRRFWDVQAALSGVGVPERITEHYRRLAVLRRDGRVGAMGAEGASSAPGGLDLRGFGVGDVGELTLLRHGDPLRALRVRYCGKEVLELPLPLQPSPAQCRQSPMSRMREKQAAYVGAGRIVQYRAEQTAVPGTSHYPPFRTHLSIAHQLLQFRGAAGQTTLVASLGVAMESARELVNNGVLTAQLNLALIDTAHASVMRTDTVRSFRVGALPPQGWVLLGTELSTNAGSAHLYRIGVMDATGTAGRVLGGEIEVRSFAGDSLRLSDVLVTPQDGTASFARGDVRLSLAPGREYRSGEQFTLYYEVYGLDAGSQYRTQIEIRPQPDGIADHIRSLFPGAPETVRLAFDETVATSHEIYGVQQTRSVGLDGLVPGTYELRITVTDAAGRAALQTRTLYVAEAAR